MTAPSKNNIYLIGLMGSGKTTIGRLLARRMGRVFFDSDHEIEHRTGVRIPVIFELEGEAGFRRREAQTIAELGAEGAGVVLATGGGVVLDPANREVLRNTGWVVYLDVPTHILFERTRHDANRPLLRVEDPLAKLNELRAQRDPLYRETAHFIVDGARCNSNGAVSRIIQAWERQCAQSR